MLPVVGGKQGHAPVEYFCSNKATFVSIKSHADCYDCHKVDLNLATLTFVGIT